MQPGAVEAAKETAVAKVRLPLVLDDQPQARMCTRVTHTWHIHNPAS